MRWLNILSARAARRCSGARRSSATSTRRCASTSRWRRRRTSSAACRPRRRAGPRSVSFGNFDSVRERAYAVRGGGLLETFLQDVRYGARVLAKHKGFTAVAVLTLALGIGANTAIFSVVIDLLLRPLPYPGSERIVMLWEAQPGRRAERHDVDLQLPGPERAQLVLRGMAAFADRRVNLTGDGDPEEIAGPARHPRAVPGPRRRAAARPRHESRGRPAQRARCGHPEPRLLAAPVRRRPEGGRQGHHAQRPAVRR